MRDQHEERAWRRLFKILEQRIGCIGVHVVCGIDDGDAVGAVMRGHRQEPVDLADLVDGDHGLEALGLFVDGSRQVQHGRMRSLRNLAEQRRSWFTWRKSRRRLARHGIGQQVLREMEREGRLADAGWSGQQQRMMQLAGAVRGRNLHHRFVVTDKQRVLGGLCNARDRVELFGGETLEAHAAPSSAISLRNTRG